MLNPVNIKSEFGSKYRIGKDPAFAIPGQSEWDRSWLYTIPCKAGGPESHIYSHGYADDDNALGYYHDGRGPMRTRLLSIPGVVLYVDFSDSYIITFPLNLFKRVAKVVRPYRKRQISAAYRKKLTENLAKARLKPTTAAPHLPHDE